MLSVAFWSACNWNNNWTGAKVFGLAGWWAKLGAWISTRDWNNNWHRSITWLKTFEGMKGSRCCRNRNYWKSETFRKTNRWWKLWRQWAWAWFTGCIWNDETDTACCGMGNIWTRMTAKNLRDFFFRLIFIDLTHFDIKPNYYFVIIIAHSQRQQIMMIWRNRFTL